MTEVTTYVVGFYYLGSSVLLIRKNRPEWQKGKWNGVGGHIEAGETSVQAMRREFREETGTDVSEKRWQNFAIYRGKGWEVHFYRCEGSMDDVWPTTTTDEAVGNFAFYELPLTAIPNLHWLIPMSCDKYMQPKDWPFIVEEKGGK